MGVGAIISPAPAVQNPQKLLQLFLRADRDARKPRSQILAALPNQNPIARQTAKQSGAATAKIGEQKVACAGKHANIAPLQFRAEPLAHPFRFATVALNRASLLYASH